MVESRFLPMQAVIADGMPLIGSVAADRVGWSETLVVSERVRRVPRLVDLLVSEVADLLLALGSHHAIRRTGRGSLRGGHQPRECPLNGRLVIVGEPGLPLPEVDGRAGFDQGCHCSCS